MLFFSIDIKQGLMPITGTIEQATKDQFYLTDSMSGDILFRGLSSNISFLFGYNSNTTSIVKVSRSSTIINTSNANVTGRLGIKKTNPAYELDVNGNINFTGQLYNSGSLFNTSPFLFNTSNAFFNGGYVGIGVSNPTADLEVAGTVKAVSIIAETIGTPTGTLTFGSSTSNGQQINIGGPNDTVNISGMLAYVSTTDLQVTDRLITVNKGGLATSGIGCGLEVEENGSSTAYIKTTSDRTGWGIRGPQATKESIITTVGDSLALNNTITITNASNVGIGTSNPSAKLDVAGTLNAQAINLNGSPLVMTTAGGFNATSNNITYTNCNVGVNTSSPAYNIDVNGTGRIGQLLTNTNRIIAASNMSLVYGSNSDFAIKYSPSNNWDDSSATTVLHATSAGNVGIGTTTPSQKLDVTGSINASDKIFATNNICIGTNNTNEKLTMNAGNIALVHSQTYGDGTNGKWMSVGDKTQTTAPLYQTSNYGVNAVWDNGGVFVGLRDYGTARKDAVIAFGGDSNSKLRVQNSNTDLMVLTKSGTLGIGLSNPNTAYLLDVKGTINATSVLVNGEALTGGGGVTAGGFTAGTGDVTYTTCNVGIGLSNPSCPLEVSGTAKFSSDVFMSGRALFRGMGIGKTGGSSNMLWNQQITNIAGWTYDSNVIVSSANSNYDVVICAGVNEIMRIEGASNYVGICTSNPQYTLDVAGTINACNVLVNGQVLSGGGGGAPSGFAMGIGKTYTYCNLGIGVSNPTCPLDVGGTAKFAQDVFMSGKMQIRGMSISKNSGQSNILWNQQVTNIAGWTYDSNVVVSSANSNYDIVMCAGVNEIMRIKGQSMNVGIGTSTPASKLDVNGGITATGYVTSFANVSDISLKENLSDLPPVLPMLEKLNPIEFTWKDNVFNEEMRGKTDVGLIAQEVANVFPLVSTEIPISKDKDCMGIKYEKMVPYLVKAIQELADENKEMKRAMGLL
jgi:hypothetical protein